MVTSGECLTRNHCEVFSASQLCLLPIFLMFSRSSYDYLVHCQSKKIFDAVRWSSKVETP